MASTKESSRRNRENETSLLKESILHVRTKKQGIDAYDRHLGAIARLKRDSTEHSIFLIDQREQRVKTIAPLAFFV
jgi:hypothetical protein